VKRLVVFCTKSGVFCLFNVCSLLSADYIDRHAVTASAMSSTSFTVVCET